jgi:glucosylceramidase
MAAVSPSLIVGFAMLVGAYVGACSKGSSDGTGGNNGGTCDNGRTQCGNRCVDTATSNSDCGGCGRMCGSTEMCSAGACVPESSGSGGRSSNGGTSGLGGTSAGGGTFGAGGAGGAGGVGGSAGTQSSGGQAGSGSSTGGTSGSGGFVGSGGAPASGGAGGGAITLPVLVTSTPSAYWKTDGQLTEATGTADITVNDTAIAQSWEGFGGAFNEMGWNYLSMLSQGDRDKALNLLFGRDGANFAWARIPIGATDFSLERYTLDETPGDTSMASFSIERDQQKLIPFVKAAQTVKPDLHFWASPWTPPTWMKESSISAYQDSNGAFDGGTMKGDDTTLKALADYLVKFVQAYGEQQIKIDFISPQNEPGYVGKYPTCGWSKKSYATFVGKFLGPAITTAGLSTKIMLGTFNSGKTVDSDQDIVTAVMTDTTAKGYIRVMGFQWGMDSTIASVKQYGVPVWQTEHKCGNYPWESGYKDKAPNDQAYAVESWGLARDWINKGVTAYSVWNLVLDTVGRGIDERTWAQNALLTVDTSAKTLTLTPTFHVFRHLSQFVAPGAKVVGTTGGDALAFKNSDGTIVVVAYNSGAAKTMTVAAGSKKLQFSMPGNGWATVVSR